MADPKTSNLEQVKYVSETPEINTYIKALQDAIQQKQVIKIFENLLTIATEEGASDIHIECFEHR